MNVSHYEFSLQQCNPLYLIIDKLDGYIEEKNRNNI